ncbi:MAG TPA: hypothetical protein V6D19_17970, partial [Stenomitos sp.]
PVLDVDAHTQFMGAKMTGPREASYRDSAEFCANVSGTAGKKPGRAMVEKPGFPGLFDESDCTR